MGQTFQDTVACYRPEAEVVILPPSRDWIWIYSRGKNDPGCTVCEVGGQTFGNAFFLLPPPPVFLGLLTRPAVPWCAGARCVHPSPHHVSTLSAFGGLAFPGRVLFFRGKIRGGVENAVSHRGHRDHSQKQRAFPAVLSRSSGETQLPQRSHLCVVGFPAWTPWAACRGGLMLFYPSKAAVQKINGI